MSLNENKNKNKTINYTYVWLYNFLQDYNGNIIKWLEKSWKGRDKQESLLRLFVGLGLIKKIDNKYYICTGNFSEKTIRKMRSIRDIFYNEKGAPIKLKDTRDISDLTCINKENKKNLLVTTSKNLKKYKVGELDIERIDSIFIDKYENKGYNLSYCICVKNKKEFMDKVNGAYKGGTCGPTVKKIEQECTIIIDWDDLDEAYHQFKKNYGKTPINNIIESNKSALCLRMHQSLAVFKIDKIMKRKKSRGCILGHIQRSGKSYIIVGSIIKDSKERKDGCNYLVITTAPNETTPQQKGVFNCYQLKDFNIIELNGTNRKKPNLKHKNTIILCSKQFLQSKISPSTIIDWLKEMSFNMRFIDESHNGGTTQLTKKVLEIYGKKTFTVHITATYFKPINDYNIPKENWVLWDLEDIKLCKNIRNENNRNRLVEKHGECINEIISKYPLDNIINEYSNYPELWVLTNEIKQEHLTDLINRTKNNNYGWSTDGCFLLNQGIEQDNKTHKSKIEYSDDDPKFQNEDAVLKIWYTIFGKKDGNIPDKHYPNNIVFMERIKKICNNAVIKSRFIGQGEFTEEPMIIMAFLPQNNIARISKATKRLLEKYTVIPDYEIICINSKTGNDPKKSIEDARARARINENKGVLVLSGKQCSLGVTIDNCDIVLLLNNNKGSSDIINQMQMRCMTEGKDKKCGFVVDLNIHREIENCMISSSLIKPSMHPKQGIKYLLEERLVIINGDHWMPSFGKGLSKIKSLCNNMYELYSSNIENALNHFLDRLRFKEIKLTKEDQKIINDMFSNNKRARKIKKKLIDEVLEGEEEKLKKGIEKIKVDKDIYASSEICNDDLKEEKKVNYMDILRHIIPLVCILTIRCKEISFVKMVKSITNNINLNSILIEQTKSWWGKSIDSKTIEKVINVYVNYMEDDEETSRIIRTVKELFMKNIKNSKELSKLIDKYLIPQELEKKRNAEISTPFKLRQEMLDKIPDEFWQDPNNKVFEPCSGKGGFIVDIIDRFMIGLEKNIPDENERYKTIVEECLYFSDINPTNIFICKLLIDPNEEYELNYNTGDTLELKWDIKFDAVIGNPPYQVQKATGDNKLYLKFIRYSIENIVEGGLLLFIVPINIKNYITNQDKNRSYISKFRKIRYLSLNTSNKYFPNIGTYFSYFLMENTTDIPPDFKTKTEFMRGDKIEKSYITIKEKDQLPLTLSNQDFDLINKVSNLIKKNNHNTFDIKKALYKKPTKNGYRKCSQRIRKSHIDKKVVIPKEKHKEGDNDFKYKIIDKINKRHKFPGIYYYNNYEMLDYGKKKIIMSCGGYLMPSLDEKGEYNLSDNIVYMLYDDVKEYEGLKILINSLLIKYLNKVTMTDGMHGRDLVIKNIKKINLINIYNNDEKDIYKQLSLTDQEIELMKNTIN